jgi:Predicted membrane protein
VSERLDTPKAQRRGLWPRRRDTPRRDPDSFGQISEGIARFMGTPRFLLWLTIFCAAWLAWNSWGPEHLRFDSSEYGFTALTLMLSLQASYSAPLILLAQNRQADRDRVQAEQDRQRAERNLADTEYLAREVAALRIALSEVATRDFVRSELRGLLEELQERSRREDETAEQSEEGPEGA